MNSVNATVLEFDFTPISPTFSFDFLFASEEYGNFQCQFSDAFAFLLTNTVTGVTTNLAVVPNTNLPISVVTIRDFLYNSSCPSANVEYFGSYNGGSAAATAAVNFNGQTKLMNASAVLTPIHLITLSWLLPTDLMRIRIRRFSSLRILSTSDRTFWDRISPATAPTLLVLETTTC
jgi:hypothetical protein